MNLDELIEQLQRIADEDSGAVTCTVGVFVYPGSKPPYVVTDVGYYDGGGVAYLEVRG